jgi:hypothetical protein
LRLKATAVDELPGTVVEWATPDGAEHGHPERPCMYVFGHHDVRHASLVFGPADGDRILISWSGVADVFWDDEFRNDVPFGCECFASVA